MCDESLRWAKAHDLQHSMHVFGAVRLFVAVFQIGRVYTVDTVFRLLLSVLFRILFTHGPDVISAWHLGNRSKPPWCTHPIGCFRRSSRSTDLRWVNRSVISSRLITRMGPRTGPRYLEPCDQSSPSPLCLLLGLA